MVYLFTINFSINCVNFSNPSASLRIASVESILTCDPVITLLLLFPILILGTPEINSFKATSKN